jgi:hypothetical protein
MEGEELTHAAVEDEEEGKDYKEGEWDDVI